MHSVLRDSLLGVADFLFEPADSAFWTVAMRCAEESGTAVLSRHGRARTRSRPFGPSIDP